MIESSIITQSVPEKPRNCWTRAEQSFYEVLPHLKSFRDMVLADDLETARSRTFREMPRLPADGEAYEFNTPLDAETLSAFGLVGSPIETPYRLVRSDSNNAHRTGVVIVQLQRTMSEHAETDQEYFANESMVAKNYAGCIMEDLWDYMREQGGPWIHEITCDVGPYRVHEEESITEGRWQVVNLSITWGLGGTQ